MGGPKDGCRCFTFRFVRATASGPANGQRPVEAAGQEGEGALGVAGGVHEVGIASDRDRVWMRSAAPGRA